ncbi:DUF2857 domain-containing protein [Klebsiella aerogenes]|uniref:DUF2857 domain-containing protein n=1 Tax=Klebsiella aerogenes TaxID=548 RepID=A0AAP9R1S7_KLEAE|nr:DUF2857 domain-containing protein [Klebsiella aerogenes]QMR42897.1 DUF2857 domain-containing protein [Klebsiella aerogenes]
MSDTSAISQAANHFLLHLVMELKAGNIRRCEALGIPPEVIRMLRGMTLEELQCVCSSKVSVLSFAVNSDNLLRLIDYARQECQRNETMDRALALGASIEIMHHYFGINGCDVAMRRRIAGIVVRDGREYALSDDDLVRVWHHWVRSSATDLYETSSLDALMLISEETSLSLTAVWRAVREYVTPRNRRSVRLKKNGRDDHSPP